MAMSGRAFWSSWAVPGSLPLQQYVKQTSMKRRSAPKEKCPRCLSLRGPLGDTPPNRDRLFLGPCQAPKETNTKVASAEGHSCAYPTAIHHHQEVAARRSGGTKRATSISMALLCLQSSEGKFTMSREIEPAGRSFRRRRSCPFAESDTFGAFWEAAFLTGFQTGSGQTGSL